ncbi:carboxypeptidase-like regulatory domain-containing protein [Hanstruepera marina]|uniref:carboxypeptidase-like regulatory domain-containing protein n=1 Tax=Hanstruepera marina TaxID=2873265 RepID=UPI001CA606FF|nr:carboxypeptidase-like regulatory domain-containing protein [Hanstruepera marina]
MKKQVTLPQKPSSKNKLDTKRKNTPKTNYHWPFDLEPKRIKKSFGFAVLLLITVLASHSTLAQVKVNQGLSISGTVTDNEGPLLGVNIIQKGAEVGTSTDSKGQFTFPKALQPNDVLVFTYLGYETQEITITNNTTQLDVVLVIDSIAIRGALEVDTPYKSKRTE